MDNMPGMSPPTGSSSSSMMPMSFYWGRRVTILFSGWTTGDSLVIYFVSLAAVFLMAFLHQLLGRFHKQQQQVSFPASGKMDGNPPQVSRARSIFLQVTNYAAYTSVGYLLMLMVMSFNVGVFVAVVLGASAGFMAFHRSHETPPVPPQP